MKRTTLDSIESDGDVVTCFLRATRLGQVKQIVNQATVYFGLRKIHCRKYVSLIGNVYVDEYTHVHLKRRTFIAHQPGNTMLAVQYSGNTSDIDLLFALSWVHIIGQS